MPDNIHVVQMDRTYNDAAQSQATTLGLSRTKYIQLLLEDLAEEASPIDRHLVQTKVMVDDSVWQAVARHARSRGRTVSALLIDEVKERSE